MRCRLFKTFACAALLALVFGSLSYAGVYRFDGMREAPPENKSIYERDKGYGWYWYEIKTKTRKKKGNKQTGSAQKPEYPDLKNYTYKQLWNMDPDRFQALLKQFLKKAVRNPTPENVKEYLIMQDIAEQKATAFAAVAEYVYQTNPYLSNADVYPIAAPGRVAIARLQNNEVRQTIEKNKNDFALIVFYQDDCPYCRAQFAILRYFQKKYGWRIKPVNIQKRPDVAAVFGIKETPSIILVHKGDENYIPISAGVVSVSELEKRVYRSIRLMKGEITPQQWFLYNYEKGKGNDPLKYLETERR